MMQANQEHLSMLSDLLTQSLSPQPEIRHPAEKNLDSSETQEGFLLLVLNLVRSDAAPMHVRQAAGVYFKNVVKKRWTEVSIATNICSMAAIKPCPLITLLV
jgi:exportin-2 (importin alpha re-exporter)